MNLDDYAMDEGIRQKIQEWMLPTDIILSIMPSLLKSEVVERTERGEGERMATLKLKDGFFVGETDEEILLIHRICSTEGRYSDEYIILRCWRSLFRGTGEGFTPLPKPTYHISQDMNAKSKDETILNLFEKWANDVFGDE